MGDNVGLWTLRTPYINSIFPNEGDFNPENSSDFTKINAWIDSSVKVLDQTQTELELQIDEIYLFQDRYFVVNDAPYDDLRRCIKSIYLMLKSVATFDPFDDKWSEYLHEISPQVEPSNADPLKILRKSAPTGYDTSENGPWVELNLGIAEAVIKGGEIKDFKIINEGNGLPSENALF